ncbi:hypothetical protein [Longimicrobium terrae]|uniref:Uncharacterized protein n=1 Tax=Longimicrobium terrae TaxID=1639882 RepID=A0A841H5A2_9BACT|nr:hypothetical protein [Longimicrobium terrae]MBB4638700.1 hypothetical protein [Longimicrobium terrae]MBB6072939.1 hypothetical protein [Longimicrobium terrae]NNC31551.1 hypothetical protein [Longimicrobium terrae]
MRLPKHSHRFILALLLTLAGCAAAGHGGSRRATLAEDERAVWSAYLEIARASAEVHGPAVVIDETMLSGSAPERGWLETVEGGFPYAALLDAGARSEARVQFSSVLGAVTGVRWLTNEEREQVFTGSDVQTSARLHEVVPGAIHVISMSRPGFDRTRTHAALAVSTWCGPLCGHGGYVLFRRQPDGRWTRLGGFTDTVS